MKISCPHCHTSFQLDGIQQPKFCPVCGKPLTKDSHVSSPSLESTYINTSSIYVNQETEDKVKFVIGPYQVIDTIGKGGMGEVFLAYDVNCGRKIALKRIRSDLSEHIQMHNRFLKEARITSQLTHPAIIPIYTIQSEDQSVYYTMPFVEGDTLKEILRVARKHEKQEDKLLHIGSSIQALIRIYLSICQAVAYAHAKGILHRDLKPENVIVGKYGEVLILDWGLAKVIHCSKEEKSEIQDKEEATFKPHHLTHLGRIVGTLGYMAPERVKGHEASKQTDIYSLGIMLYQILTLRSPFRRKSIKDFRANVEKEILYDPCDVAPYRDIPHVLSRITLKCLAPPEERYQAVTDLIQDLENYIEGRSEWFQIAELQVDVKDDWEFQENILIAEHTAITRGTEISDWVSLMISKASFSGNTKIEATVKIGDKGHGLGFLFSVPESAERENLNDGYCLWLSSDLHKSTKLLRSTVEVMHTPDVFLKRHEWYRIRVEKIDQNIHFYLNDVLQFSYISHLPLVGTHIGILSRDADFSLSPIRVYVASQNVQVNCLAIPDAFLAHKDYGIALNEYRRIGYSFPGRAEGREALFKAGITLLEEARTSADPIQMKHLYDLALEEFEKLHSTPGAPFEYLGKALVYEALKDFEEEIKCFELAYRRYPQHPLLPVLQEQIVYRMHESSRYHRKATYNFILLVVRFIPSMAKTPHCQHLFNSLKKHWEPLYFIENGHLLTNMDLFSIQIAFWLAKPYVIREIFDQLIEKTHPSWELINTAIFCVIEIGSYRLAKQMIDTVFKTQALESHNASASLLQAASQLDRVLCEDVLESFFSLLQNTSLTLEESRILIHCLEKALIKKKLSAVFKALERLSAYTTPPFLDLKFDSIRIRAHLLDKQWITAGELLSLHPLETLTKETTVLHSLYGCWLMATEGKEIAHIHFSGVMEVSFPRTWNLLAHAVNGRLSPTWFNKAFFWEKRQLFRQQFLYAICEGNKDEAEAYRKLEQQEYIDVEP